MTNFDHLLGKATAPTLPADQVIALLTKREYFAGLAMQALISASGNACGDIEYYEDDVAANAVIMADHLIAKLSLKS